MYSEEQVLQKVSNKKQKEMLILTIAVCIFLIIVLAICMYFYSDNLPLVDLPTYTVSPEDWTTDNVVVTITNNPNHIQSYSFDGGLTWQANSSYTVTDNKEIVIQVLDTKNKYSRQQTVTISNIDRNAPEIEFTDNPTTIQMGQNWTVGIGAQVTDKESGLSNNYTAIPPTIDTSREGTFEITYSAFDRAGNFAEKKRTVIVKDTKGRTYYRYRDGRIESYECEPYLCKCVTSSQASSTGTCPTGYTLNSEGQCCNTCYKMCSRTVWGEWSEWSQKEVTPTATREVETMIRED